MRASKITPVFLCVLFVTSFAFAGKVRVDYDHGADFSKYRTFMWVEKPVSGNSLMDDRIVNSVTSQLRAKGLEQVESGADLAVSVTTSTQERQILNTYYNGFDGWGWGPRWGWGWGWGGPGWATTYVNTYLEGTTVVDLIDNESDKMIWHGTSVGTISHKPEKAARKTAEAIEEMFEDYPPLLKGRISD